MKNIVILVALLSLIDELPELPEYARANRRANRAKAIAHNRKVYHDLVGSGIWYEVPENDGSFVAYHRSKVTNKPQQGRWATERLSGHRRFQRWSRDYYPSFKDELGKARWKDELKDYFNE